MTTGSPGRSRTGSFYLSQVHIQKIIKLLTERVEDYLDHLDVKFNKYDGIIFGPCPVHQGDNGAAFNVFMRGHSKVGNWTCFTKHCEKDKDTPGNLLGLTKGILRNTNPRATFYDAALFALNFLNIKSTKELDEVEVDAVSFFNPYDVIHKSSKELRLILRREDVRKLLKFPVQQLINRGLKQSILDDYDIGLCQELNKPMSGRIVVPVYDEDHKYMVGCMGRSIYPKCDKCSYYHKYGRCPTYNLNLYTKWRNSKGFRAASWLYNFWAAKSEIIKTRTAILVEGSLDTLKLVQAGIKNVVGTFGDDISDEQLILLERCGVLNLVLLFDNDEAGMKGKAKVRDICKNLYNIKEPAFPGKDIGELSNNQINEYILPQLG